MEAMLQTTDILELLPHRYPFLLIDRVRIDVAGQKAVGFKAVTNNEPFFQGHFPGYPVMPGVLMIEAMAQTAAVVVMHGLHQKYHDQKVYFMSIEQAKFRKPVFPGNLLEIEVEKVQHRGDVWRFAAQARILNEKVAEATYTAMIASAR